MSKTTTATERARTAKVQRADDIMATAETLIRQVLDIDDSDYIGTPLMRDTWRELSRVRATLRAENEARVQAEAEIKKLKGELHRAVNNMVEAVAERDEWKAKLMVVRASDPAYISKVIVTSNTAQANPRAKKTK